MDSSAEALERRRRRQREYYHRRCARDPGYRARRLAAHHLRARDPEAPWSRQGISMATWYARRQRERSASLPEDGSISEATSDRDILALVGRIVCNASSLEEVHRRLRRAGVVSFPMFESVHMRAAAAAYGLDLAGHRSAVPGVRRSAKQLPA